MDSRLKVLAEAGDINLLYTLIAEGPSLLDNLDDIPFVETPLHAAASFDHTEFAAEMMRLKPSFAKKPNPQGYTPLQVAFQNVALDTVVELINIDPQLIRVKGRGGMTPLHFAAEKGYIGLLTYFLLVCPDSITESTVRNETALHIAVKHGKFDAFDVLIGWLQRAVHKGSFDRELKIHNMKDIDGNTVLHIAVQTNQPQVVRVLLGCRLLVAINVKNKKGLTPLDISELQFPAQNEIDTMLRDAGGLHATAIRDGDHRLSSKLSFSEKVGIIMIRQRREMSDGMVNVTFVVVVLVLTAMYQSVLSPPGGFWQDNKSSNRNTTITNRSRSTHRPGTSIMSSDDFQMFWTFNMSMLLLSILTISFVLLDKLLLQLLLLQPVIMFVACFGFSMSIISPVPWIRAISYTVAVLCYLSIVMLFQFFRWVSL